MTALQGAHARRLQEQVRRSPVLRPQHVRTGRPTTRLPYPHGVWRPDQLDAAGVAYAEVVRRLHITKPAEQRTIATLLLGMTDDGCLDRDALVQQCVSHLHALTTISIAEQAQATVARLLQRALSQPGLADGRR